MLYCTLLKDNSGNEIKSQIIVQETWHCTSYINTERADYQALLLVAEGTVGEIQREVSVDGVNFYKPYDTIGVNLAALVGTIPGSRMLVIDQAGSNKVLAPWTRFRYMGANSSGTVAVETSILTMYYVHTEE